MVAREALRVGLATEWLRTWTDGASRIALATGRSMLGSGDWMLTCAELAAGWSHGRFGGSLFVRALPSWESGNRDAMLPGEPNC